MGMNRAMAWSRTEKPDSLHHFTGRLTGSESRTRSLLIGRTLLAVSLGAIALAAWGWFHFNDEKSLADTSKALIDALKAGNAGATTAILASSQVGTALLEERSRPRPSQAPYRWSEAGQIKRESHPGPGPRGPIQRRRRLEQSTAPGFRRGEGAGRRHVHHENVFHGRYRRNLLCVWTGPVRSRIHCPEMWVGLCHHRYLAIPRHRDS